MTLFLSRHLRRHQTLVAVASAAAIFLVARAALAQDLSGGVSEAGRQIKDLIGKGIGIAGAMVAAISLGMAGFKFSQKDPNAVWYIAGTLAGGVLFAVAKGMVSNSGQ